MPCAICDSPVTVDAHLIPRALIHDARKTDGGLLVGSRHAKGAYKSQAGLSDKNILCRDHEDALGHIDRQGIEFCRTFRDRMEFATSTGVFRIAHVDSDAVVRFAASILWRFHISQLFEAAQVDVGPYEPVLRGIVFEGADVSSKPETIVVANRWGKVGRADDIIILPVQRPHDGVRHWHMTFAGLTFLVKLDKRAYPLLDQYKVNGRSELVSILRDLGSSIERPGIDQIVSRMGEKRSGWGWQKRQGG